MLNRAPTVGFPDRNGYLSYAMHAEDVLGSIEVGKLADFVVIPVDYMTIPAQEIWKIKPEMTVIDGEVVYTKPLEVQ